MGITTLNRPRRMPVSKSTAGVFDKVAGGLTTLGP